MLQNFQNVIWVVEFSQGRNYGSDDLEKSVAAGKFCGVSNLRMYQINPIYISDVK